MTDLIERELQLTAPAEVAWAAITDPAWLAEWLADTVELELRPGGEARFVTGGQVRAGWVEEVSPPGEGSADGRLAFWWEADEDGPSRVELEVTALPAGSRVRVIETRPLEILDLVGVPLGGATRVNGGRRFGPALVAG